MVASWGGRSSNVDGEERYQTFPRSRWDRQAAEQFRVAFSSFHLIWFYVSFTHNRLQAQLELPGPIVYTYRQLLQMLSSPRHRLQYPCHSCGPCEPRICGTYIHDLSVCLYFVSAPDEPPCLQERKIINKTIAPPFKPTSDFHSSTMVALLSPNP